MGKMAKPSQKLHLAKTTLLETRNATVLTFQTGKPPLPSTQIRPSNGM
jgi:hypothetical protein